MLSAYLYVYADKFNACVQNVRLGLKCLKRRRVSELMSASKLTRLSRSKQLLREFSNTDTDFIWFTDEKVFSVAAPSNMKNDHVYIPLETRKKRVASERLLRTRPTFSETVVVSVAFQNSAAQSY